METGATFIGVHQSGRELMLDTDISPEELEDVLFKVLMERPECPIFQFTQSGKDFPMFINLNHFSYCEVGERGEKTTDSGLVKLSPKTITELVRPRQG